MTEEFVDIAVSFESYETGSNEALEAIAAIVRTVLEAGATHLNARFSNENRTFKKVSISYDISESRAYVTEMLAFLETCTGKPTNLAPVYWMDAGVSTPISRALRLLQVGLDNVERGKEFELFKKKSRRGNVASAEKKTLQAQVAANANYLKCQMNYEAWCSKMTELKFTPSAVQIWINDNRTGLFSPLANLIPACTEAAERNLKELSEKLQTKKTGK
jgi:hypothetical protein